LANFSQTTFTVCRSWGRPFILIW